MPKAEADIRASLDDVIDDVETNQRICGWLGGSVGQLARTTRQLTTTIEDRFEQVDQRVDAVDKRLAGFEKRTDTSLGLIWDELRANGARLEKLVPYIVRDELKVGDPDGT